MISGPRNRFSTTATDSSAPGVRVEAVDRLAHRRADQRAAGDRSGRSGKAAGLCPAKIAVEVVEEVAGDADAVLDLGKAAVHSASGTGRPVIR